MTASGGNMYQLRLLRPIRLRFCGTLTLYCDRVIHARRPDITIVDKVKKEVSFVDISVPADKRVNEKESEKISKYRDLRIEVEHLWNMRTSIVPIVVGALGAVSTHFNP